MPDEPRLQRLAKLLDRIAEPHIGQAPDRQLFGREDLIETIPEDRRRNVAVDDEHAEPRVGMAISCGAGEDSALRRAIAGRYRGKAWPPAVSAGDARPLRP